MGKLPEGIDEDYTFQEASEHDKKRYDVLGQEKYELGQKVLDWYRSSHADKDNRGLFDTWEMIDLYWEGEANPPESDTDPGSNTNIVNPTVEGKVAYLVEQNLAIEAKPRGPSDKPWRDRAVMTMEFVKERNKMKRKLDVHERRRQKFGMGIFRVLFDPDCLDGMGLPVIEPCNPAYVFFDPTITDIYKIQEGRFVIEVMNKSLNYAREKYSEELVDAIEPGYHPMEETNVFGEDEGQSDEISKDSYLHMMVFTRYKGKDGEKKLRLIEMSGCGVILRDSKEDDEDEEGFYPNARYPYFCTPDMYREGTVWGKASAELLINTQDIVDDLDDQIRINARLTGNPQRLVSIDSGIDPDKISNEPAISIPTADMSGYKYVEPPTLPEYVFRRRDQALFQERQIQSRFSDQMNGNRQVGVDTATESLALQQNGTQGITHSKLMLEETLSEVFEYCLELCMEYWTESEFFELTEKPGEFEYFRPSDLKEIPRLMPASETFKSNFAAQFPQAENLPQYMPVTDKDGKAITKKIALDISVTVGAGLPSNKAFIYQIIKEDPDLTPQERRKLKREYVGLPIDEEPPMDPNQVQQMVQAAVQQAVSQAQPPSPAIMGMTQGNAPSMMPIQGGVA